MKKIWMGLLMALALMVLAVCGQAEDYTFNMSDVRLYETIRSLCWTEDGLYLLGSYGLYRMQDGQVETLVDLSEASRYAYVAEQPEDEAAAELWTQAVRYLCTDGEDVYALHPYSGQVLRLTQTGLKLAAQMPSSALAMKDANDGLREVMGVACQGRTIYVLLGTDDWMDYSKTNLIAFDMDTQTVKICSPEGADMVVSGAEGTLLLIYDGAYVVAYDIASDTEGEVIAQNGGGIGMLSGVAWDANREAVLYYSDNQVRLVDAVGETIKAYLPVTFGWSGNPAAVSAEGVYAYASGQYVFVRDISNDGEAQATVLHVAGYLSEEVMLAYSMERPDVAVIFDQNNGAAMRAALTGDENTDLFVLEAPGDLAAMKEKGYIAPLVDEGLEAWVRSLYPAVQTAVFDGDALIAAPIRLQPNSWMVAKERWDALGLGDLPETYMDVLDMVTMWYDGLAEEYPDDCVIDLEIDGVYGFAHSIMSQYILQNERPGEQLTFDSEPFREVMTALAQHSSMLEEKSTREYSGVSLLYSYYIGFGIGHTDENVTMILPPSLSEDGEQAMGGMLQVLALHSASAKKDEALAFLSWYAQHLAGVTRYELCPDEMEPIENPNYATRIAQIEADIESMREQREKEEDLDVQDDLDAQILYWEGVLERSEEMRYTISPEMIEAYRAAAESLVIPADSVFYNSMSSGYQSLDDVLRRFCDDGLEESEIDALIAELDRVAYMMAGEGDF